MASLERERVPIPRSIAAREIPLINRVEEMSLLKEAVDRAILGEGGLVFLYGEAGIGKTRLARELRAYAHLRGMRVLYGRCPALFRMDGVPPYVLWSEVVRDYLENSNPEQLYRVIGFYPAEVAKLVPEISQKLRAIPQSYPISPEHEQNRLFEAVSQFIINISREAPLLVILDDLQWTDPSSLLLLHYLARGVSKAPLLLLGAYRSTDIDGKHPLTQVLTELNRERLSQSVSLKRMSLNDVSEMIRQMLEQDDVSAEFCSLVYQKTRGNPFFAEEVMKSLKEEEVIYREEDKWKFKEVSGIEFPETVKSVVKTRIGRLDDECQNVLTMASFIGNDVTCGALCGVTGIKEDKMIEIIDKILETGLFKHRVVRGEDTCSLADIIVRDVVYEGVSPFKRKKLHSVVGQALERVYAEKIEEHFGELASHFLESGDKSKALDYFLKAGERAEKIHANAEVVSYFQSALKLLEERKGEGKERARVLEKLGDIKNIVGEYDACLKYWNEALLSWEELHEEKEISKLHVRMAKTLWERMGKTEEAKQHHDKALELLEGKPESSELAWLYEDIADRISMRGHEGMNEARSWAEKALEVAKKVNDQKAIAQSYCVLAETLALRTAIDMNKFVEYMEKALKISLDNDFVEPALFAYLDLGNAYRNLNYETGFKFLTKGFELAKRVGQLYYLSWITGSLVGVYVGLGDMEKATAMAEDSFAFDRKTGSSSHLPRSILYRGQIYQITGEWDRSEQLYDEALKVSQSLEDYQGIELSYFHFGSLYLDKGEYTKAADCFAKCVEIDEKHDVDPRWWRYQLVNPFVELREIEKARRILEESQKLAHEVNSKRFNLRVDFSKAMLLRAEKKWDESIDQFERILKEWEVMNPRQWDVYDFGRFFYEYARVYLDRDEKGDREKAHSLLNQAMEMFQKVGAKKDIEKTTRLLEALHPPETEAHEKAVSSESLERAEVQSNIIATPRELKLGESLELEIEVTNARREGTVLLTKIVEVIPEGFAVAKKPELYRIEDTSLNLKKKRLDPSKTEEVKLVLTPKVQGTFHIKPKIVYLDEKGKEKTCEPEPISVTVRELGIKGWLKGER